jgi:hypothetical protein
MVLARAYRRRGRDEVDRLNDLLSAFGEVNESKTESLSDLARRIRLGRGQTGS